MTDPGKPEAGEVIVFPWGAQERPARLHVVIGPPPGFTGIWWGHMCQAATVADLAAAGFVPASSLTAASLLASELRERAERKLAELEKHNLDQAEQITRLFLQWANAERPYRRTTHNQRTELNRLNRALSAERKRTEGYRAKLADMLGEHIETTQGKHPAYWDRLLLAVDELEQVASSRNAPAPAPPSEAQGGKGATDEEVPDTRGLQPMFEGFCDDAFDGEYQGDAQERLYEVLNEAFNRGANSEIEKAALRSQPTPTGEAKDSRIRAQDTEDQTAAPTEPSAMKEPTPGSAGSAVASVGAVGEVATAAERERQSLAESLGLYSPKRGKCVCWACLAGKNVAFMVLCPTCGNKRCPKANDHRNECSGSNEPGQVGSACATDPPPASPPASDADGERLQPSRDCQGCRADGPCWQNKTECRTCCWCLRNLLDPPASPPPAALGPVELMIAALRNTSSVVNQEGQVDASTFALLLADELTKGAKS